MSFAGSSTTVRAIDRGRDEPVRRSVERAGVPERHVEGGLTSGPGTGDLVGGGQRHGPDRDRAAHVVSPVAPRQRAEGPRVLGGSRGRGERDRVRGRRPGGEREGGRGHHRGDTCWRNHRHGVGAGGPDVRHGTSHRLDPGEFRDTDRRLVQVARIDRQRVTCRRRSEFAGTAEEAEVVVEPGVVHETRIVGGHRRDVTATEIERVGRCRAILLVDVLAGRRRERRPDHRRCPVRMRPDEERAHAGDVRARHRCALDGLEQLARRTEVRRRRVAGEDLHAGGRDVGLDDVGDRPVRTARREHRHVGCVPGWVPPIRPRSSRSHAPGAAM